MQWLGGMAGPMVRWDRVLTPAESARVDEAVALIMTDPSRASEAVAAIEAMGGKVVSLGHTMRKGG